MRLVPRRVDQGDGPFLALVPQEGDLVLLLFQLLPVTLLERLPPGRIVGEPLPQLRARGHFLQPQIQGRPLLAQPARPQPLDQDPKPVLAGGLLIGPLQLEPVGPLAHGLPLGWLGGPPASGGRWAGGEDLRDEHRGVLQADERMGFPGGQDEHLARPQLARRLVGGERDPPFKAVDRDLPAGEVGGISRPLARVSRRTSSVAVFASRLDGPPDDGAGPAVRTSMTSLSLG